MTRGGLGIFKVLALVSLLPVTACGPAGEGGAASGGVVETAEEAILGPTLAGCSLQAVEGNGLVQNGICQNGLSAAGLDLARLGGEDFTTWFNADPAQAAMLVKYTYRCAAPASSSVSWTNPATGVRYTWTGGLGLAPYWMSGAAPSLDEQQLVTACLGAMVNKYGVHVEVAIEGRTATGAQIGLTWGELSTYSQREACFFGNLFTGAGVFVGPDHPSWNPARSSVRGCAVDRQPAAGPSVDCPSLYYAGDCSRICTLDATGTFYETCTFNGVRYRPLTTRIKPSDVFTCGDGVCQVSESCGTGYTAGNCHRDCGACP